MDLYILDSLLRRSEVVDQYESLIWTERWAAWGDFELVTQASKETRQRFSLGTKLAINQSTRVMVVEQTESKTDNDGTARMTVRGRSLEHILEDRITKTESSFLTSQMWRLQGDPAWMIGRIFQTVCREGLVTPFDKIPFLVTGKIYPNNSIPFSTADVLWSLPLKSLYATIKETCDAYNMGFRITRGGDSSKLYFDVYTGDDRTARQSVYPAVVFAPELDNLQNTTDFFTMAEFKNVAYVVGKDILKVVYAPNTEVDVEGFERHVLHVDANDIDQDAATAANTTVDALLGQRGKEALAKQTQYQAFDGELSQNSAYVYDKDYRLGDFVDMRNIDGATNKMRVTEQIFVSDSEGERSYPTLTLTLFVEPGSWLAKGTRKWIEMGPTAYWSNEL